MTAAGGTIAACATPAGRGALAVVRLSGPHTAAVRDAVLRPCRVGDWAHGRARRVDLVDRDGTFDDGMAVFAAAPRTYTGEDSLEITLHGNPLLVERLLAACLAAGARLAGPGEFTRRAAVNGKLDLVAAEGVDQLIRASTPAGVQIARQAVSGRLSDVLLGFRATVVGVLAELEARLDYPADELAFHGDDALLATLAELGDRCSALADTHEAGRRLVEGARVALVGPVNAGKSSLFNALLRSERALVHERAGTTRDVVEARTRLGPLDVTLLDTAGERETDDPIEAAGLALAQQLVAGADLLLVVLGSAGGDPTERAILARTAPLPRIVVSNQIDRLPPAPDTIAVSARTGAGLESLERAIVTALLGGLPEGPAIASLRQADLLRSLARASEEAAGALPFAGVAVAAEILVEALGELDALTGADTREDVLDAVFARFCIGK
ncbi:MAG: tRNA modification GTPase [Myxococcota bacterium]